MDFNTEKVLQEIDKIGQYLADKLQVPVEMAYEILMKQVIFELSWAVVWAIIAVALMVSGFFLTKLCIKNKEKLYDVYNPTYEFSIAGSITMGLLGIPILIIKLHTILQIAINPEWYMIQMLLEKLQ